MQQSTMWPCRGNNYSVDAGCIIKSWSMMKNKTITINNTQPQEMEELKEPQIKTLS